MTEMRILELFSGTGSVCKVATKLGYEVISVDISEQFHKPTHLVDLLEWDYTMYSKDSFDMIWASPPCRTFSSMLFLSKTQDEIFKMMEDEGIPLLRKTEEIIEYFKPKYYFIENPANGRMKNYIKYTNPIKVSYCQYGFKYQKNTSIWTNKTFIPKKCSKKTCKYYGKHRDGIKVTNQTQMAKLMNKYKIPEELILDLIQPLTNKRQIMVLQPPTLDTETEIGNKMELHY